MDKQENNGAEEKKIDQLEGEPIYKNGR